MEKRLSQRMAESAVTDNKSNSKLNLSAFIILRDEIFEAINDGWSVRYVWEVLYKEKKITFGYQTFLNYVNKYKNNSDIKNKRNLNVESKNKENKKDMVERYVNSLPEENSNNSNEDLVDKISETESELSQDRINITNLSSDSKEDHGNPKGFEWDTDFDPKDFV